MPISGDEKEFVTYVVELMQSLGPVHAKRMFGGHGIFLQGLMFGLIADQALYLKVDDATKARYSSRGLEAFSYNKKGQAMKLSYFQAPESTLEDQEDMHAWAQDAYAVALRQRNKKNRFVNNQP